MDLKHTVVYGTVANGTAQYASGDVVGGTLTYSALNYVNGSGLLDAVTVTTLSGGSVPLTLAFFHTAPTTAADNALGTFAAADLTAKLVGVVSVGTADYVLAGTAATPPCVATKANIGLPYTLSPGGALYCVPIVRGTPTFTAANHLIVTLGVKQD